MKDITSQELDIILGKQKDFFKSGKTKDINFRKESLERLYEAVKSNTKNISDALKKDLNKSFEEAYLTEIGIVLSEIREHLSHLKKWSKPKHVSTPLFLLPSTSKIVYEPLGNSLIIAPWNYPFQLLFNPLVGAISSGCTAILKPSPYTPEVAKVMDNIIKETFNPEYITVVQGGRDINKLLLEKRYDIIFFTGSPVLGKVVMEAASKYLTPVVLELGGKSPVIVDRDANLKIAARRIVWGKLINAGQTCIAPDYLFVQKNLKNSLVEQMKLEIERMYGKNPKESEYYPRIVNSKAVERLKLLIDSGKILFGGEIVESERYIAPTILDEVNESSAVMKEEIFGPILPIMTFDKIDEALEYVYKNEKPLALYYFGSKSGASEVISKSTSGGGCINDTLMHVTNDKLPFGGVGNSGMGRYHGYKSFLAFTNERGLVSTPTFIDLPFKYVPFKFFNIVKQLLK